MSRQVEGPYVAAVEAVYTAAVTPETWPAALQAIADIFGDVGSLLLYQRDDGSLATIVSPGLEPAQREYIQGEWWRSDIRLGRAMERGYAVSRDTVTERHIVTSEEMESLPTIRSSWPARD